MNDRSKKYMNPYFAGLLIGIAMIAAYYFSAEGLGSSGAFKTVVVSSTNAVAPEYAKEASYFSKYVQDEEKSPIKTWLVFEMLGVIAGGIISASLVGRMKIGIGKSPKITNKTRLIAALSGGILWGVGTQLGRGCTSGLIMSGMSVNSLSGYIGLITVFGVGYVIAYFFRKLWI